MGTVGLAIRMVISLAAVLCLLFLLARFTRRGRPRGGGPDMTVLSRCAVGSKASVAVVQLGDRALVVGVTEQSVTLLSEAAAEDFRPAADDESEASAEGSAAGAADAAGGPIVVHRVVVDSPPRSRRRRTVPSQRADGSVAGADPGGRLSGSALAPDTWRRTIDAVREMTVRR